MYCPAHFEEKKLDVLVDLIKQYPLATIVSTCESGLVANHIPLHYVSLNKHEGKLIGHVAKGNPLWQSSTDKEHLIIFQGPSSYISPNWYATKTENHKVVPTWNYAVVQVHTTMTAIHDTNQLLNILTKLTEQHEASQEEPWQIADAPQDFTERLLNNIVGIEFHIHKITGKWKVSQNQPTVNKQSLVSGLSTQQQDSAKEMARLVKTYAHLD